MGRGIKDTLKTRSWNACSMKARRSGAILLIKYSSRLESVAKVASEFARTIAALKSFGLSILISGTLDKIRSDLEDILAGVQKQFDVIERDLESTKDKLRIARINFQITKNDIGKFMSPTS